MYHTIVVILLSGILSATCVAQEQATAASPKALTDAEAASPNSKAIVLVIDANSQQSVAVKQVVEALEEAGIATGKSAETRPPKSSSISVTLGLRKDVSHDKVTQLIKALVEAGVHRVSFGEGLYQGEEQNRLEVRVEPGYSERELAKIYRAVETVKERCGLTVLVATSRLQEEVDVAGPLYDADPAMDSYLSHEASQIADLRTDYEAADKQAHDLAESLRKTPDPTKKAKLRIAVQRAFTLRQSLLRAELQKMQARLEKTQRSLDLRERIADQIVDRRVADLLNPELDWGQELNDELRIQSELRAPEALESRASDD